MLFFNKAFFPALFCFSLLVAHNKEDEQPNVIGLSAKAALLSGLTGGVCGFVDYYISGHIGFPLACLGESEIRRLLIKEMLFHDESRVDERSKRQERIVNWFGWGTSWVTWVGVMKYFRDSKTQNKPF